VDIDLWSSDRSHNSIGLGSGGRLFENVFQLLDALDFSVRQVEVLFLQIWNYCTGFSMIDDLCVLISFSNEFCLFLKLLDVFVEVFENRSLLVFRVPEVNDRGVFIQLIIESE